MVRSYPCSRVPRCRTQARYGRGQPDDDIRSAHSSVCAALHEHQLTISCIFEMCLALIRWSVSSPLIPSFSGFAHTARPLCRRGQFLEASTGCNGERFHLRAIPSRTPLAFRRALKRSNSDPRGAPRLSSVIPPDPSRPMHAARQPLWRPDFPTN